MKIDSVVFYSSDIDSIIDFYVNTVGLTLEYRQGEKYVSFLFDNGVRLGIKKTVEEREVPGAQTVFIGVENAEEIYKLMQAKKVDFHKPLGYMEGFGHNFAIYDPDKNKVQFIQREEN